MPRLEEHEPSWFIERPQVRYSLPNDPALLKPEQREELLRLGASLAEKQLQPVGAYAKPGDCSGELYWGFRRVMAAKLVKLPKLMVLVFDSPLSVPEIKSWQLVENMSRQDLTAQEQVHGCIELMKLSPLSPMPRKDLTAKLKIDPGMVTKILSYLDVCPEAQTAFDAAAISLSDVYALSRMPLGEQLPVLQMKLSGALANRNAIEQQVKNSRKMLASVWK